MNKNVALISGISGQDGSFLAEQLLNKGFEVHGIIRRQSTFGTKRIDHVFNQLHLHYGDLTDANSISNLVAELKPEFVINLGCQSHVKVSFENPNYTVDTIVQGTLNLLEAIRQHSPETRFYQASSSEMFGDVLETPQTETTPFNPQSPYGCAKCFGYFITKNYRKAYNLFAANGILYNHESRRRSETFVTRKITRAATRIKLGLQDILYLGNTKAKRDWGDSEEYMDAIWRILNHTEPDDFIIATGKTHSVQEFADIVFKKLDLNSDEYIKIDPKYFRPAEVNLLLGDPSKAKKILGWEPKVDLEQLATKMIEHDLKLAEIEKKAGVKISDY